MAPDLSADIQAWTEGWARSRGVVSPRPINGGVHIRLGTETESARYVLTTSDTERAQELASHIVEPNFWIKWPAAPDEAEPTLPVGWRLVEPQFLMGARLTPATPTLPDDFLLSLNDEGDALEVRVTTEAGVLAASGRAGLTALAVPDQIVTRTEYQRRGLGRAVMGALSNAALDRGRSHALLLASGQGRRLYDRLGWRVLSPFWAAKRVA